MSTIQFIKKVYGEFMSPTATRMDIDTESAIKELKLAMEVEKLEWDRDKLLGLGKASKWNIKHVMCPSCLNASMTHVWPCCGAPYWECWECGQKQKDAPEDSYKDACCQYKTTCQTNEEMKHG